MLDGQQAEPFTCWLRPQSKSLLRLARKNGWRSPSAFFCQFFAPAKAKKIPPRMRWAGC